MQASRTYGYCRDQNDSVVAAVNCPCTSVSCPCPWPTKTDEWINFHSGINGDKAFIHPGFGVHAQFEIEKGQLGMSVAGQLSMQSGDLSIPI